MALKKTTRGFTLVEIMFVVAIVGVLSSVAVPRYLRYSLRARQAEAFVVLGAVKNTQFGYLAANDCFSATIPNPPLAPLNVKSDWDPATNSYVDACQAVDKEFSAIGFTILESSFYHQFACEADNPGLASAAEFTCSAAGDLDGDGLVAEFIMCTDQRENGFCEVVSHYGNTSPFPLEPVRVTVEQF